MRKLGEIFIELTLNDTKFKEGLARSKSAAESTSKDIEKVVLTSQQKQLNEYDKFIAEKDKITQKSANEAIKSQDKAAAAIMQNNQRQFAEENKLREAAVKSQQTYMQKMTETSKHVIQAAPGYAIATAAIASVYVALRAVRDEFVRGLSAVEDYSLKVASMGAFLTTFSTNLTKTNASEIYRASTAEAQKLVQAMEKLDARTIATGKDLTTMAEQFIKGGVRIDTTNKGTMDGFANIANALKLMTQGQNQEIQMRQEIRALVQGQLKDTNILAKTLQSIDPNIKEHIKLWRQQGTLIENVGALLAGFGPAAKDLQNTWAVVGSTMETIHTRILRDGFKKTHSDLIELAKKWNSVLMDSEGNLTNMAKNISSAMSVSLEMLGNIVGVSASLVTYIGASGLIVVGLGAISKIIGVGLVASVDLLTAAMMRNPLFAIGFLIIAVSAIKTWADRTQEELKKVEEANDRTLTASEKFYDHLSWFFSKTFSMEPLNAAFSSIYGLIDTAINKVTDLLKKMGMISGSASASTEQAVKEAEWKASMQAKEMQTRMAPEMGDALGKFQPLIEGVMSPGEVLEEMKEANKYLDVLREKAHVEQEGARITLESKIANGEFAKTFELLRNSGHVASTTLEEWTNEARKLADTIDDNKASVKFRAEQQQSRDSLNSTIKSLQAMNLTQEKSQSAIWQSNFANSEYVKSLKLTGKELESFKSKITSEAEGADQRKATNDIEDYIEKLKEKIVVLNSSRSGLTEYQVEEGKVAELFQKAGIAADKFKDIISKLTKEFVKLSKEAELEKLENKMLSLSEKYSTDQEKIIAQNKKAINQIDDLIDAYEKKGLSAVDTNGEILKSIIDLYGKEEILQKKSQGDWEIANTAKGRSYKELSEGIYKSLTDSFEKIFDKGENVFKSLTESIISLFKRMLAQMVALAIARPIIVPVISAIGGAMGVGTDAQASVLKGMGIDGAATGAASGLAGLAGAAQIGSMGAGYTSPGNSALAAGIGMAGVGIEAFNGTVGASMAALQSGVGHFTGNTVGFAIGQSAGVEAGNAILDMTTQAFAGWTAGISTFVIGLLRGQSFKDAALQGAGAGLGAWAGGAIGSYFGPVGTATGAIIGAQIGSWVGSLFGSKENKFTLTELVQPKIVDTIFEKTKGLEAMGWTHGAGGNEWYAPVANAYAQMVDVINTSFTENVFAFAEAMPDTLESLFLDKIAATNYSALLSEASGGRWAISDAKGALEGVATAYATALAKVAERSYTEAIADFFATAAPSEMLGPELAGTWDILTDQAQAYVKSLFVKAGEAVTSGGLEAGLTEAGKIAENMQALQDALAPIQEIIDTNGLSEYELSIRSINKQFDDYAVQLRAAGIDLAKYTKLEEARGIAIAKVMREISLASLATASDNLREAYSVEQTSLATKHEEELDNLNNQLKIVQDSSTKLTSIVTKMRSALDRMNLSSSITLEQRDTAFLILQAALSSARTGDLTGLENIDNQLNVLTSPSEGLFASFEDYQRDYWKTYNAIAEGESIAKNQLSLEEITIGLIEQQISDENSRFQAQSALLTAQLNALLGINSSVLSLGTATQQYKSAESLVNIATNTASSNPASLTTTVADMYQAALGREADPAGLIYWSTQLALAGGNVNAIKDSFFSSAEGYGETVQRFATGGSFKVAGGSGVDNLSMSRLRVTAGEMVNISKKDSISDMANEIKSLREELGIANFEIVKSNKKIATFLERWDGDGIPEERVLA